MNIEQLREYCLKKKGVSESFPFDEETLVFKVSGKMFALLDLSGKSAINLKCDPEMSILLREQYSFIVPGYHMNKKHWNTISITNQVTPKLIFELIDISYNLVFNSLTKKQKEELNRKQNE